MPNCEDIDYSIKRETGGRKGFALLALLTEWHLHCLKKIQSEEHSEFPKEQERILFDKIKDQVKKLKNELVSFDVKDLKDIGVSLLDYGTVEDTNFKEFLVESLLSSYRAILGRPLSESKLRGKNSYEDWKSIINQLKENTKNSHVNEYLKIRRDANSLYKIYSTIDSLKPFIEGKDISIDEKRLTLQILFHITGEYLKDTKETSSLSSHVKNSLKKEEIPVEFLSKLRDKLAHNQIFPLIKANDAEIKKLFDECFIPIQMTIKNKIIEIEKSFIKGIIERNKSKIKNKPVIDKLIKSVEKEGIQGLVQYVEIIKLRGLYNSMDEENKKLVDEIRQNAERMKSKDFSINEERLSRDRLSEKHLKIQSSITEFIDKSKLHAYEQMYGRLCSGELNKYINLKNAHDDVVAVTQMMDHLRYKAPVLDGNVFDNFLNTQVFAKIPLKVNGYDTTLKEELKKYFDAESFKKKLFYYGSQGVEKKLTKLLRSISRESRNKQRLIDFFNSDSENSYIQPDEYEELVNGLNTEHKNKEELLFYSIEWRKKKCIKLLEKNPLALKEIYDDILEDRATEHSAYQKLANQYQLTNKKNVNVKIIDDLIQNSMDKLYFDRIKEEVGVLKEVTHPYAVKAQIINIYSLLERAEGSRGADFQLRKLRNYLAHGDVLTSNEEDEFLAEQLAQLKTEVVKELGNSEITFEGIKRIINKLQSNLSIDKIRQILCPISRRSKRDVDVACVDSRDKENLEEQERKEERIKELFNTDEMKKIIENAEFYNQFSKIAKQISAGEAIDRSIEKAFVVKVRNMNLDLIDPEIRNIVEKIKGNINDGKINERKTRAILRRHEIAEKIGKISEKANLALSAFFVGKHIANGDIEGLGYDALNLWVMPKIGEKISGKMLALGGKLDSQMLRGFAPIAGRAIGNLFAFIGFAESIKARINSKDSIDKKIADLNIATNSIFIAADMPAVATEVMAAAEMEIGMVGEFAGPVGAAIAVAVVIIGQFVEAEFEVEKLEELMKLTNQERRQFYWDFLLGMEIPKYIERDIEARKIYEHYISSIIDKFKDSFDTIAISLPKITFEEREYIKVKDVPLEIVGMGGPHKMCEIQKEKKNLKLEFFLDTMVDLSYIDNIKNCCFSKAIPEKIQSYDILCGPINEHILPEISLIEEHQDPSFESCDDYFKGKHNGIVTQKRQRWFFDENLSSCDNAVIYDSKNSNKYKSLYYIRSRDTFIKPYENSNITVIFDGDGISVNSIRKRVGVSHHIENRYHFLQRLRHCEVYKSGNNFFYITGSEFSCNLGDEGQRNIVVTQGNFTDSSNKKIQGVIGSNETNHIEVSYAGYVDGKGGNDTVVAKNSAVIKGYFGDNIYGKSLVLLPMGFGDINRMTLVNNTKTIYSKGGHLTIRGKEMLMKTRDGFFITPTKIDDKTKMVTDLHVVNYNKTEVSGALKVCSDNEVSEVLMDLAIEELYLKKIFRGAGFHFMRRLFGNVHIHKDAYGCIVVDSTPVIITAALQGKLVSNSNFEVTKQILSNELDVVIGDTDHHIFYADKQSHFFYWEGGENVLNYYLFGSKNVTAVINKANGLLDFSELKSGKTKCEEKEDAIFIVNGDVRVVLPLNYKSVTITSDGKEYYRLLQGGTLEREYCSHSLKVDGRFSVNSADLLNYYNCFMFDSNKVLFSKLNNDLLLLSDKGALSISEYYSFVQRDWNLSIRLNDEIIEPEEFKERAGNPSSFRYYQLGEQGLQIYHNQPINKHQVGIVNLKDRNISDLDVDIDGGSLLLSYKNKTLIKVENWNTYQPAREMMFVFNDTVVSNAKCVVSDCAPEDVIEEFQGKKRKERKHTEGYLGRFKEEKLAQHKHRHHHGNYPRRHGRLSRKLLFTDLTEMVDGQNISEQNDEISYNKGKATSGASKPSSWINVFANTLVGAVKGISQFISSPFRPAIEHSHPSRAITTQNIDTNGTLFLLDVFIRKITGQKYIATADQPMPLLEARGYAMEITTELKIILESTAKKSGISVEKLSFDIPIVQRAIETKIINGELSKIPAILYSAMEEAYLKNEKFLSILKGKVEKVLSKEQIVNSSNQKQNITSVDPLSSFNSITVESANNNRLKGAMYAG